VAGLWDSKDEAVEHYPWEDYWMDRMGILDFPTIITFDPGLNKNIKESDILSPSWFDRKAKNLLNEVRSKREVLPFEDHLGTPVLIF